MRNPASVLLIATGLWLGCASSSERPSVDAASLEAERLARGREVLREYLEETQPLDHTNSLVAYDVAQRGPELVPALVAMLREGDAEPNLYHLIRLGCTMIRETPIEAGRREELRSSMETARERMWYASDEARLSRAELRNCQPSAVSAE